jgi:hypothetical protein
VKKDFEESLKKLLQQSRELTRRSEELMARTQQLLRQAREDPEKPKAPKTGKA